MNNRSKFAVFMNAKINNFDASNSTLKMIKPNILFLLTFLFSIGAYAQSVNQVDDLGQKQGKWIKTYQNGNTRYEGQFRNDKAYGTFTYYYEGGAVKAVNTFSDDGMIAESKSFHPNGKLMAEGNYLNQEKHGMWKYYSDIDEKLVAQEKYSKGELNGECINYYPETGNFLQIVFYTKGKLDGPYKKYFPDGQTLMTEGFYKDGLLEGEFITYHPDGKIQTRGQYTKEIQTGKWEYFDEEGNLLTEEQFKSEKR
jgi:antitoxin component YwqK of YwqJK toxin-antitoxin module